MALPSVSSRLEGWALHLAHLSVLTPPEDALDATIADVLHRLRQRAAEAGLPRLEPVAEVRRLFRRAGTDPTRYRPASEGLARRVLRGDSFPRIAPVVELTNLLELELLIPASAVAPRAFREPLEFRAGRPGERMDSLRGPLGLEAKPLLADPDGPFASPITDGRRAAVAPDDREALLVTYVPQALRAGLGVEETLERLTQATGAARIGDMAWAS